MPLAKYNIIKIVEMFLINFWQNREVSPTFQHVLDYDEKCTVKILNFLSRFTERHYRKLYKILEVSGSFVIWCSVLFAYTVIYKKFNLTCMEKHVTLGVFIEVLFTSIIKIIAARQRPMNCGYKVFGSIGSEIYSFPSGHTARATYITYFFTYLYPQPAIVIFLLLIWTVLIALSRVLLKRHFLFDIIGGILTGWLAGKTVGLLIS